MPPQPGVPPKVATPAGPTTPPKLPTGNSAGIHDTVVTRSTNDGSNHTLTVAGILALRAAVGTAVSKAAPYVAKISEALETAGVVTGEVAAGLTAPFLLLAHPPQQQRSYGYPQA
jgi:hypothetical protein